VKDFALIETMLWEDGFPLLALHLERLRSSAEYFGIPLDAEEIRERLKRESLPCPAGARWRFRLRLHRNGHAVIEAAPMTESTVRPVMRLAQERIRSADISRRHKTTDRALYDRYTRTAAEEGIMEYLFVNERGEAAEGSIHTLFIETESGMLTPSVESGALPGVFRRHVLESDPRAKEAVITLDDVRNAKGVFLCNALRGMRRVTFMEE
jgi:para-aminobenzoate synthetase/4-amino-4-deoxychorismate lyase